jgi:hypothetical protein
MTVFCTYCSKNKNQSSISMPAIDLYSSNRIKSTYKAAQHLGLTFCILSGKYGLVDAEQNIKHYDHLLIQEEVNDHAKLVSKQIHHKNITSMVFFQTPTVIDINNKAYIDCIKLATDISNIQLALIEITIPE